MDMGRVTSLVMWKPSNGAQTEIFGDDEEGHIFSAVTSPDGTKVLTASSKRLRRELVVHVGAPLQFINLT